jgi:hypothetical protein
LRDRYEEFTSLDVRVAAIGLGDERATAEFSTQQRSPFPVLADPAKVTYKAFGLEKGRWREVIGPQVWVPGARAVLRGRLIGKPKQNPLQLGGVAIVQKGGEIVFMHRSADSSDNPPLDKLLEILHSGVS